MFKFFNCNKCRNFLKFYLQLPWSFSKVRLYLPVSLRIADKISKVVLVCVVKISCLSSLTTGTLLISQLATGLGAASMGISNVIFCPARTTKSLRQCLSKCGLTAIDKSLNQTSGKMYKWNLQFKCNFKILQVRFAQYNFQVKLTMKSYNTYLQLRFLSEIYE